MLKHIKIRGYKSLKEIDVQLNPLVILFGPNASGKSNFLDALQLLSRMATSRTLQEAFEPPYRGRPLESFSFGTKGVKAILSQPRASFMMEADLELSPLVVESVNKQIQEMKHPEDSGDISKLDKKKLAFVREKYLRYRIEIEILPKSGILRVTDEYLASLNVEGSPNQARRPFLELMDHRLSLRMEGQAHPTYYERFLDHTILSRPLYPPHYPHLTAVRQELASWFFFYFEPRERMRMPNPVKEVRHIGLFGEELAAFLNTLQTLDKAQFNAVEKALNLIVPSITGIDVQVNDFGEVELNLLEGDTPIPARVLSEGTLRILGLLALGGSRYPAALLGFEEPENGVHPRRIRMISEALKTRVKTGNTQLIATTHSPILPDLIPDESLYVCQKTENVTQINPFSTWGTLARKIQIDRALDVEEDHRSVSERIMRGDFDA